MEENRFQLTGTVIEVGQTRNITNFIRKRDFKLQVSDTDFSGRLAVRKIKLEFMGENCDMLNVVSVNDIVQVRFLIDGRDYEKDSKKMNFTSLQAYDIFVIKSDTAGSDEDRSAVVTNDGVYYPKKEITLDDIMSEKYSETIDPLITPSDLEPPKPTPEKVDPLTEQKEKEFTDLPF